MGEWQHFRHEADIGIRGLGNSLEEAFEQAGMALTAVITDPDCIVPAQAIHIRACATDTELLFVDWLNALLFEMATRHMLFSCFEVEIQAGRLRATARGEAIDPARHQPTVEIKGATYTALCVRQRKDGSWLAQCVVDV